MFQNVAYGPTEYRTRIYIYLLLTRQSRQSRIFFARQSWQNNELCFHIFLQGKVGKVETNIFKVLAKQSRKSRY